MVNSCHSVNCSSIIVHCPGSIINKKKEVKTMFNQNGKKNTQTTVEEQQEIINAASYLEAIKEQYNNNSKETKNQGNGQKQEEQETGIFAQISLRTKATLLAIGIGVLPVLATGVTAYIFVEKTITKQVYESHKSILKEVTEDINRFMLERYGDTQVLSQLPALTNPKVIALITPLDQRKILQSYIDYYKFYDNITTFDLNGNVTSQAFIKNPVTINYTNEPIFQEVLRTRKIVIIEPKIVRSPGEKITTEQGEAQQENLKIEIGVPLKETNTARIIGVLRLSVPVKHLENLIKEKNIDKEEEYHIVNNQGKFIIARQKNEVGLDATDHLDDYQKYKDGKQTVVKIEKEKNDQNINLMSYSPIKITNFLGSSI
jgi:methyl-accepting chemotaxis protein PixJ